MPNIQTQGARNTDPITSHLAIEALTSSGVRFRHQDLVRDIVQTLPGKTAAEYAAELQNLGHSLDHHQVQRRLSELDQSAVKKSDRRKCSVKGTSMCTWVGM